MCVCTSKCIYVCIIYVYEFKTEAAVGPVVQWICICMCVCVFM